MGKIGNDTRAGDLMFPIIVFLMGRGFLAEQVSHQHSGETYMEGLTNEARDS